jgi:hypothetical protein
MYMCMCGWQKQKIFCYNNRNKSGKSNKQKKAKAIKRKWISIKLQVNNVLLRRWEIRVRLPTNMSRLHIQVENILPSNTQFHTDKTLARFDRCPRVCRVSNNKRFCTLIFFFIISFSNSTLDCWFCVLCVSQNNYGLVERYI